jgi:RNA polymerase sigma-70 factor, ECF subfamily
MSEVAGQPDHRGAAPPAAGLEADPDAFWSLVAPHDRALRALAYRLLGDVDVMDDVLQVAYLKAFRALASFEGRASFRTWLYRIVHNACMDELRRRKRTRLMTWDDEAVEGVDPLPDPGEMVSDRQELVEALAALPEDMRAAVLLVDAEGMGYHEAAAVLGVPRGTLAARLHRARARLRQRLGGQGGERW